MLYQFTFKMAVFKKKWCNDALAVHLSIELWMHLVSWESTREAIEKHSTSPRATQTLLSCFLNFSRASITRLDARQAWTIS